MSRWFKGIYGGGLPDVGCNRIPYWRCCRAKCLITDGCADV